MVNMRRPSVEPDTISIHFVQQALHAGVRSRVPLDQVLEQAAIPRHFLDEPLSRVSPRQFGELWRQIALHLGDEFFALGPRPAKPGTYALLCQALLSSESLHVALKRLCRYTGLVFEGQHASLEVNEHTATLRLQDDQARTTPFAHATYFMMAYGLACWLIARRIPILSCGLGGHAPGFEAEYKVMFCEQLAFGAQDGTLVMPASMLTQPVLQSAESLRLYLQRAPDVFLVKYRNTDSIAGQVRTRLRHIRPVDWPDLHAMSASLNMAQATFRRRLDSEGTTFQAIKDHLRRDMAITALREDRASIEQIAHDIGFAEAPAFHRAFKKWTGMRPSDYRRGTLEKSQRDGP